MRKALLFITYFLPLVVHSTRHTSLKIKISFWYSNILFFFSFFFDNVDSSQLNYSSKCKIYFFSKHKSLIPREYIPSCVRCIILTICNKLRNNRFSILIFFSHHCTPAVINVLYYKIHFLKYIVNKYKKYMEKHMNVYTLNKYGNNIKCNRYITLYIYICIYIWQQTQNILIK